MKDVGVGVLEVDELDAAVALLGLVVPAAFAAQPRQHFAVALDGRRDRVERLDDRAHRVGRQPRVEFRELRFELVAEQHAGFAAALLLGDLGRERRPADFGGVLHHRELDGAGFADLEVAHAGHSFKWSPTERRKIEIGHADFAGHQLVQQRLEQVFEHRALAVVQVDLAVDGVEDFDDFALLSKSGRKRNRDSFRNSACQWRPLCFRCRTLVA